MKKNNKPPENKNFSSGYQARDISVLSPVNAIRKNPGMYIGSVGTDGLHRLAFEVIDNAVDEVIGGFCRNIQVSLHRDGSCSVKDDGRGIPVDMHPEMNKPASEVVLTTLHSGGKFDGSVYTRTAGLHGVGLSTVNALSQWLICEIWRDGCHFCQKFIRAVPQTDLQKISDSHDRGTKITFCPDPEIFSEGQEWHLPVFEKRMNELAFLHPGLQIELIDEKSDTRLHFSYETGIAGFVEELTQSFEKINEKPFSLSASLGTFDIDLALQWTFSYEPKLFMYVNSVPTPYGGTHEAAVKNALVSAMNNYAKDNNLLESIGSLQLNPSDILEGLTGVLSLRMQNPIFEGQSKLKLTNEEIYKDIYRIVYEGFSEILNNDSRFALTLLERAREASLARLAAKTAFERAVYQKREHYFSEKVYQKQFGIRSKNWHESAQWLTHRDLIQKHADFFPENKEALALDVCCGSGIVGESFKPKVKKIIGFDLTPEMVQLAQDRLEKVDQGNVYDLPYPENTFDLVVTREVLHLLPNPERPVAEIFRVLKPGGQFINGQILPFGPEDAPWMFRIFKKKQPLLFNMFQDEDFKKLLLGRGFIGLETSEINVWESIDVWINTHETTPLHRHEIRDLFYNAPKEAKAVHPFKILSNGEIQDLWRWVIFSVRKPQQ